MEMSAEERMERRVGMRMKRISMRRVRLRRVSLRMRRLRVRMRRARLRMRKVKMRVKRKEEMGMGVEVMEKVIQSQKMEVSTMIMRRMTA
jgi:hypothetical protein